MTKDRDYKTAAIVLRRTNLGEADRLLDLLTPDGRVMVMARAARKEKSRLAGGIELFCLSNVQIHYSAKTDRHILSGAKMQVFYNHILENLPTLELASSSLKAIERASRDTDSPVYFSILKQIFAYLNRANADLELASVWFNLNLQHAMGNELNLMFDTDGNRLEPDQIYTWDPLEMAFKPGKGPITANHIKFLRLCLASPLALTTKIKNYQALLPEILPIVRGIMV